MTMEEWVHKMCLHDTLKSLSVCYNHKIAEHIVNEIKQKMAYLAVNKDGSEYIFADKPYRDISKYFGAIWVTNCLFGKIQLPKGSIKKLIGRELSWSDEAVEI